MSNKIHNNRLQILGKMSASLVHELRNPLSALKLNLSYLRMNETNLEESFVESLDDCLVSVDRLNYLIETTLNFSRKCSEEMEHENINDIINQAISIITNNAGKKGIGLNLETGKNIPPILLNRNKFLQVILNLLTNAVEASSKNDVVSIKTEFIKEKNRILLSVKDNGVGIPEAEKKNIFNDFYTSKQDGTGLGLSVCKQLLEEINAEIYFESKEGVGSSFFISIDSVKKGE